MTEVDIEKNLTEIVGRKSILLDEPMSNHTSFKIGGPADYFVKVSELNILKDLLKYIDKNKLPFLVIGNGTNLLVRDGGIRGIVIKCDFNEFKIKRMKDKIEITAGSGLALSTLANICLKEEITGLEFASGIPGTIGGALRMNAGAFGSEMKDVVIKSRYLTFDGKIKTIANDEHKFQYRNSALSKLNAIIVDTTILAHAGTKSEIKAKMDEYAAYRKEKQPLEYPNAGSTFKRNGDLITAKLIDEAGLKGYSVGGAEVSTKHAGFIINKNRATADDVIKLTKVIQDKVKEKFDVNIDLEILIVGEDK